MALCHQRRRREIISNGSNRGAHKRQRNRGEKGERVGRKVRVLLHILSSLVALKVGHFQIAVSVALDRACRGVRLRGTPVRSSAASGALGSAQHEAVSMAVRGYILRENPKIARALAAESRLNKLAPLIASVRARSALGRRVEIRALDGARGVARHATVAEAVDVEVAQFEVLEIPVQIAAARHCRQRVRWVGLVSIHIWVRRACVCVLVLCGMSALLYFGLPRVSDIGRHPQPWGKTLFVFLKPQHIHDTPYISPDIPQSSRSLWAKGVPGLVQLSHWR